MARAVHAHDCGPTGAPSRCLDADTLWVPPSKSRLVSLPSSEELGAGNVILGLGMTWLWRPIVVTAPSGDPSGRVIPVVEHALDATLLAAVGVGRGSELTGAMPFALRQTGAGPGALLDQHAPGLVRQGVRDPRIGWSHAARWRKGNVVWGIRSRLELTLPLATDQALAGARGPVLVPALSGDVVLGRLYLGAELGARLRRGSALADAVVGSQLMSAVGVSVELLRPRVLALGLELRALPSLVSQPTRRPDGTPVEPPSLIPAEWMASLALVPIADGRLTFQLGGGGGLPLSTIHENGTNRRASGVTTPDTRLFAGVRGVFGPSPSRRARPQKIRSEM